MYRRANSVISPIAFSITLDDFQVIDRAIAPADGQRIVCLASAGDTPLNLLRHDPAEVVALDISGPQVYLTRLKQAAAGVLELLDYRLLLGATVMEGNAELLVDAIYGRVRPYLDEDTRAFWDDNRHILRRGIMWQGAVQRISAVWGPLARWRIRVLHRDYRLDQNPYLAPMLLRTLPSDEFLPPYLSWAFYPGIQKNLDRLSVVHSDIRTYLRTRDSRSVDAFALSNIADWLPRREVPGLLKEILRVANPGARVLLCGHRRACRVPPQMADRLVPNLPLQGELKRIDRIGYFRQISVLTVKG